MAKSKKSLINLSEAMAKIDAWRNGKGAKFTSGDVVERRETEIGVICFPHVDIETYQIKWYKGPKPWDFIEGVVSGKELKKSDKPNPLKYKSSDRYPGPASYEIDRLNAIFDKNKDKPKTPKEVEEHISILEEEINRNYDNKKDEEIDSVVDETLDPEPNVSEIIDSVDIKRKKLIDDEI